MKKIELLSPARNLECGLAAINHGADAVYIGASQFGARAAAGNSIEDIASLVDYAHPFRSKVYVAMNTILTDEQLPEAEKLIHQIYEAGADALIVQDMGILKMNLPPIALHASTQTDNRSLEKVKFLQDVGFSRVVLARELSLNQISSISSSTQVELEAFVHGALCVSYSGQCYMSEANCGHSANRGQCAQYCRLPYQLLDADKTPIVRNKHLLSLKDLDLSNALSELMDAGVMSFKIEGRMKDAAYVKNITAYYRQKLDALLEGNPNFKKSSLGKTSFFFEPNPEKSFRRGATDFFLHERQADIVQQDTPKSLGEPIGKVNYIGRNFFEMQNGHLIHNGDGLCFVNKQHDLTGFRVNRVERKQIFPADMPRMDVGAFLYRNQDQEFDKLMKGKTAERKVAVDVLFGETDAGFFIQLKDEEGVLSKLEIVAEKQLAQKPELVQDALRTQLSKLGNTIYQAKSIELELSSPWFFPVSLLSEWRRQAIDLLDKTRAQHYSSEPKAKAIAANYPLPTLTYLGNVSNKLAEQFYLEHGVQSVSPAFEVKAEEGVPLMYTKHCMKYTMGWCPRKGGVSNQKEPFYLKNNDQLYLLSFDCKACEMQITKAIVSPEL